MTTVIHILLFFLRIAFASLEVSKQFSVQQTTYKFTIADTYQLVISFLNIVLHRVFFSTEGNEVLFWPFTFGLDTLQKVSDGKSDLATSYGPLLVLQSVKGKMLSIVSSLRLSNDNTSLLAHQPSGIKKTSQLVGKTIAIPKDTCVEFFLNMFAVVAPFANWRLA